MKGKRGAIELSIGTIVVIVLAMSMLILGLVLVRNIFSGTTNAVDSINKGVINEINEMFVDKTARIAIAPSTRKISIEQGAQDHGFAFSVRNINNEEKRFTYDIFVDSNFPIQKKCNIGDKEAEEWLLIPSGSVSLGPGQLSQLPELVTFQIPPDAPVCTIPFTILIKDTEKTYVEADVELTIEPA